MGENSTRTQATRHEINSTQISRPKNQENNGAMPPTPCKYCPDEQWHFHSQCQNNPYRKQENFRGAGATASRERVQAGQTQSTRQSQDGSSARTANPASQSNNGRN